MGHPSGAGTLEVIDAATEEVIGSIPDGNADDIDRAVDAAVGAFESWSATTPRERSVADRIADGSRRARTRSLS